jgi:hypothetical protein
VSEQVVVVESRGVRILEVEHEGHRGHAVESELPERHVGIQRLVGRQVPEVAADDG